MKVRSFHDDLYGVRLFLVWNVDGPQLGKWMKKTFSIEYTADNRWGGRCIECSNDEGAICVVVALRQWNGSVEDYGILAHEALHGVEVVMERIGVPHGESTSEAFTYLLQSYFVRCLKLLGEK